MAWDFVPRLPCGQPCLCIILFPANVYKSLTLTPSETFDYDLLPAGSSRLLSVYLFLLARETASLYCDLAPSRGIQLILDGQSLRPPASACHSTSPEHGVSARWLCRCTKFRHLVKQTGIAVGEDVDRHISLLFQGCQPIGLAPMAKGFVLKTITRRAEVQSVPFSKGFDTLRCRACCGVLHDTFIDEELQSRVLMAHLCPLCGFVLAVMPPVMGRSASWSWIPLRCCGFAEASSAA